MAENGRHTHLDQNGYSDPAIDYRIADLDRLDLPEAAFDLVYSALAFHYVADFDRLIRMIHRALSPGGDLVFTIEHPIFMAAAHPHWTLDEDGRKTWPVNGYSIEGERRTDWFANGVLKHHRTLATTINTLIGAGFTLRQVEEFAPTAAKIEAIPVLAEELERPMCCSSRPEKPDPGCLAAGALWCRCWTTRRRCPTAVPSTIPADARTGQPSVSSSKR